MSGKFMRLQSCARFKRNLHKKNSQMCRKIFQQCITLTKIKNGSHIF